MEQTKGYFRLEGKIWGLNNKKLFENDSKRSLSFGIQSNKANSNYVQVGEWKNSKLNVKVKANSNDEVQELGEQEAIDFIKENFKDGDSVYINVRASINTYYKKIDYMVSQIYKKEEDIDFESADFKEVNELNQSIIITEKPSNNKITVGLTTYKGEMIEQELELCDKDVNEYFEENVKVGDLLRVTIYVNNKPIYEDGDTSDDEQVEERTTLKGKKIQTGGGNGKKKFKKITGHELSLEIVDVDFKMTEKKKYTREEIREALELANDVKNKTPNKANQDTGDVSDEDLPF